MKPNLYKTLATPDEINAQYRVAPNQEALFAARRRAEGLSAQARATFRHERGVRYGDTAPEYLNLFPAEQGPAPVFVFLHGGYWRAMSADDYDLVATGLVPLGFVVVSVNYALAPDVDLWEIVRQSRAALAWVADHIVDYGGDPSRIVIAGHSAGGHLAALCLQSKDSDTASARPAPKGALLISGLFDLEPLRHSFLQPDLKFDDAIVSKLSPINLIQSSHIPVLLTVGGTESSEFHRQTAAFQSAWNAAGNWSKTCVIEGADHFGAVEPLLDGKSGVCAWIRDTA